MEDLLNISAQEYLVFLEQQEQALQELIMHLDDEVEDHLIADVKLIKEQAI